LEQNGLTPKPPIKLRSQAERIIDKFGSVARLLLLLREIEPSRFRHPSTLYRWRYPRSKGGTGGLVPTSDLALVIKAAKLDGIFLTEDDLYPGARP